ncbi:hypothetical protein [Streptomyces sp. NPDC020362]|uniref:hypothetical protein n=1 Tax=unclassified Streptomyces TaxID=2593676 RepID=UPI000A6DCC03
MLRAIASPGRVGRPHDRGGDRTERQDEAIFVHPSQWYTDHEIDLRLDGTVTTIDR